MQSSVFILEVDSGTSRKHKMHHIYNYNLNPNIIIILTHRYLSLTHWGVWGGGRRGQNVTVNNTFNVSILPTDNMENEQCFSLSAVLSRRHPIATWLVSS